MLSTQLPFAPYTDLNGQPLDAGYIYFGTVNQNPETSPITVYWDVAGTVPVAQPVRTLAGFPVNNGRLSHTYSSIDYSITVKDKYGRLLYSSPTSAEYSNDYSVQANVDSLASSLASRSTSANGAGQIGFDPTLNYAAQTLGRSLADREWNPRDYPWLAKFDNVNDDTAAIQACWQALFTAGGGTMVLPRGIARVTSIVMNYTASISVNVRGQGQHATYFAKLGASVTPVLDIKSNVGVLDVYSEFADFQVLGANSCDGIKLTTIANVTFTRVEIRVCGAALNLAGCLVSTFHECSFLSNIVGVQTRLNTAIYCNSLRFYGCNIKSNSSLGMDINHANDMLVWNCDLESNGTTLNLTTGAVIIQANIAAETGISTLTFGGGTHFEANKGSNFVAVAAAGLNLIFDGVSILSSEAGLATSIQAILSVTMRGVIAASPGDTVTIGTCAKSSLEDYDIANIVDTSIHQFRKNGTGSAGVLPFSVKTAAFGAGGITLDTTAKIRGGVTYTDNGPLATFQDGATAGNQIELCMTNGAGGNAAACSVRIGRSGTTGRSINAGGTINAAGADYAEYETKREDCGTIAKGDIVGFDADGRLTDRFDLSVSFAIKSTNPGIVLGDAWCTESRPQLTIPQGLDAAEVDRITSDYACALTAFELRLEIARQKVDRIAYVGKVPVNISADTGVRAGQYVEAKASDDNHIVCAISDKISSLTVGRVRSIIEGVVTVSVIAQ